MSEHKVRVSWERSATGFEYSEYSRDHIWQFDELVVAASAAPEYLGSDSGVDPEQAYVASLSSCHMLSFLAVAAKRRIGVTRYTDSAIGYLEENSEGKLMVARVILSPQVSFDANTVMSAATLEKLHQLAHRECFIANSVKTVIEVSL
jgi:organic hydroperoxide reductase OsmC/OhrA